MLLSVNSTRAAYPNFFNQLLWITGLLYELRRLPVNMPKQPQRGGRYIALHTLDPTLEDGV